MSKNEIINELKKLTQDELGDVIIECGGFRDKWVNKSSIEEFCNIDLYYDEYKNTDEVELFIFPSSEEAV